MRCTILIFSTLLISIETVSQEFQVNPFACNYNNTIIVVTKDGLKEYKPESNTYSDLPFSDKIPSKRLHTVLVDRNNTLWIASLEGLYAYKDGKAEFYNDKSGLPVDIATFPSEDSQGRLWWFGNPWGMKRYIMLCEDGMWKSEFIGGKQDVFDKVVYRLIEDDFGNVIIGTNQGFLIYDGSKFNSFIKSPTIPFKSISCLLKDSHGNIWFGCEKFGLAKLSVDGQFSYFESKEGFPQKNVSLVEDAKGKIWFKGDNVVGYIENELVHQFSYNETKLNNYNKIDVDELNRIWLTSEESGCSVFNGDTWIHSSEMVVDDWGNITLDSIDHSASNKSQIPSMYLYKDKHNTLWLFNKNEIASVHRWYRINKHGINPVVFLPIVNKLITSVKIEDFPNHELSGLLMGEHSFSNIVELDNGVLLVSYVLGLSKLEYFILVGDSNDFRKLEVDYSK